MIERFPSKPNCCNKFMLLVVAWMAFAPPITREQTVSTDIAITLDYEVLPAQANFSKAAFRFWSPDYDRPIRAIVVLIPPNDRDGRPMLEDSAWQDFARRNRLALVSCYMKGRDTSESAYFEAASGTGYALQDSLEDFAHKSSRPEVSLAPLLLYGESNGGVFDYFFTIWKPERVMAFVVNKAGGGAHPEPDPASYGVPGLFFLGLKDTEVRIENVTRIWTEGRKEGALWALAPQPESGHEFSRTPAIARVFFDAVLNVRLPEGASQLRPMQENQGWVGDLTTHEIHPATPDNTPSLKDAWLPDETSAAAWKEFVISGTPLPREPVTESSVRRAATQDNAPSPVAHSDAMASPAAPQTAPYVPTMTFDVASIRESKPDSEKGFIVGGGFAGSSSSLNLSNQSISNMLAMAYHVSIYQITGLPDWGHAFYNVQAKSDSVADDKLATLSKEQAELERQHMMQALLADRFNLKTHWETREGPVYDLVVAKRGSMLHAGGSLPPSADELKSFGDRKIPEMYQHGDGRRGYELIGHDCHITTLVGMLGSLMRTRVIDKTGLTATYDFDLQYNQSSGRDRDADPTIWPSVPDAVEDELGLKLEPSKGSVQMLVIDHIEKPSPN